MNDGFEARMTRACNELDQALTRLRPRLSSLDADMKQMDKSSEQHRCAEELGQMVCGQIEQLLDQMMLCNFAWDICEELKAEKSE